MNPKAVAALLRATGIALRAELRALPPPLGGWHPAPGEWCIKEVLGHLIEAEKRGFAGRIRLLLDADDPPLAPWDQAAVARRRGDCERDASGLLDEFLGLREASVGLVAGLSDSDLRRGGQHPKVGRLSIGDLLHEWIHHDHDHVRQMLANVQAFVWPDMGNAQRFSRP